MRLDHSGDDIDSTAILPQLDVQVLSATLERFEHQAETVNKSALDRTVDSVVERKTSSARDTIPEWKIADQLAALNDQIASLNIVLRESENRYLRLSMRHETLLQKFEERDTTLATSQLALNQTRRQLSSVEQQLQQAAIEAAEMRQTVTASIQQRRQREKFIIKQASEIKRLRGLLP